MKRYLLFCIFGLNSLIGLSQTQIITLAFNGVDSITQLPLPLESVLIQNTTIGCDTTIYGATPSIELTVPLGIAEVTKVGIEPFTILPPSPNPFFGTIRVYIQQNKGGTLELTTIDVQGNVKSVFIDELSPGLCKFEIESKNTGLLLFNVTNGNVWKSVKLINNRASLGNNRITYLGTDQRIPKSTNYNSGFSYRFGNQLVYTSFKSGYNDMFIFDSPTQDSSYTFELTCSNPVLPSVLTDSVSNITQTTASCGGNVIDDGGAAVTVKGVCWSSSPSPTIADSVTIDGSGIGSFVSLLTGLFPDSTYYIRAYATNSAGTAYGDEKEFTTPKDTLGIPCPGLPTVLYEGKTYHTLLIGTQCWLRENLNIGTRVNLEISQSDNGIIEKYCYNDDENNCNIYGGLYQWNEMMQYTTTVGAQGICPAGWHIPYQEDWNILVDFIGGYQIAGKKLKSTGTLEAGTGLWHIPNSGTNDYCFTAHPAGQRANAYASLGYFTWYWESEQLTSIEAIYVALNNYMDEMGNYYMYKSYGLSVRCLKDN